MQHIKKTCLGRHSVHSSKPFTTALDILLKRSKLKVRFRILRVGDLLPCWHANATKGHNKLHWAWYGSLFFFCLGRKIPQTSYDCLGYLIYGHSKLSHSRRLRSAPIQNSKTLQITNTKSTVFKKPGECAVLLCYGCGKTVLTNLLPCAVKKWKWGIRERTLSWSNVVPFSPLGKHGPVQ